MGWCTANIPYIPFVPMHSCTKRKTSVFCLSSNLQLLVQRRRGAHVQLPKLHAIHSSDALFITVKSPASSGDISVLIPISAVLFFLYWIANFVVPDIITKDFQSDQPGEKQMPEVSIPSNDGKENIPTDIDSSPRERKRNAGKKVPKL